MGEVDRPGPAGRRHRHRAATPARDLSIARSGACGCRTASRSPRCRARAGAGRARCWCSGPSGAGKSSLFRGLAGIWPLGDGRIRFPQAARVLALPQRPYFPLGTLAAGADLSDCSPRRSTTPHVRDAMAAAGLGHLAERLDEEAEWNTVLSGGEQQRVGFARALDPPADHPAARRGGVDAGGARRRASSTTCWRESCPTPS